MNAVNGDKMHSEGVVRCPAIYSSSEQLAIGLEARRYSPGPKRWVDPAAITISGLYDELSRPNLVYIQS